jgi:glycosyltransferase involved in cell wall biosynthesis
VIGLSMISIIIPVYNHKKALTKALVSIAAQTYKNIEVIVVDDGSKSEIRNLKSEITLIRQENKGAPAARNAGFELSKGEYVIFWDADVVGEPEMLEKMVRALENNPEASFVYSNNYFGKKKMPSQQFNNVDIRQCNYIHSTSLIRRGAVVRWDESLKRFQDWDLWLTMSAQGKIGVWIDEYLFHIGTGGTMSSWLPKCAYKKPWRWLPGVSKKVKRYEEARDVVMRKHQI